jgi:hypothetical protein
MKLFPIKQSRLMSIPAPGPRFEAGQEARNRLDQCIASFDTAAEYILGPRAARTRERPGSGEAVH